MGEYPIFTIGYGNRTFSEFVRLLESYYIKFLIDVRSKPYCRHQIDFNQSVLEKGLKEHGIRYVFMGDLLGGQPEDKACYTDGRTDYRKLIGLLTFRNGLNRIKETWEKDNCLALMCSESKPQNCHRSKLIGQELVRQAVDVVHIDETGRVISQEDIMLRSTKGLC